jgi:membrane protein
MRTGQEQRGMNADGDDSDRAHGRHAEHPHQIPKAGWRDILLRVKDGIFEKNLSLISAGAAFYAFIAIPSGITVLISLYGLAFDPAQVQKQVATFHGVMPEQAMTLITDELTYISSQSHRALGIGLAVGLAVALWSASYATTSMITALNIVYGEVEKRNFVKFYATALVLTLATVIFGLLSLSLIAALPAAIQWLPLGPFGKTLASIVRWPLLIILFMTSLALAFRYAPCREQPKWRWISWGAVVGGILWIIASALFSFYVASFSSYDKSYGSLAGVVLLMMWLYVSAYVILISAELNAEIEHQTARDSTTGPPEPMGQRGAKMADTLGEKR